MAVISGLHIPVFLLRDLPVFPVLIKRLFITGHFGKLTFFCMNRIVQSERLVFFDRG